MARREGEALPPDVAPCPAFAMSDAFRDWAVGQMRREVGAQVSGMGLDRMAVLKAPAARRAAPASAKPLDE